MLAYYRLHGSPREYWSSYGPTQVRQWAEEMANYSRATRVWCIFDNTASGAALANAMELRQCFGAAFAADPDHQRTTLLIR